MFSDKKKREKLGCQGASMPIPAKYRNRRNDGIGMQYENISENQQHFSNIL